jgi:isopenicillin-N N-acyltransferase-like protein
MVLQASDQNFPIITYDPAQTPEAWGRHHGEEFRQGIKELFEVRRELLLAKNPALKSKLKELALEQFRETEVFSRPLALELEGLARGANLGLEDVVLLNNYTDFRDIRLPEEGCSTIHIQQKSGAISGQTWDMHGSAKKYLCLIQVPASRHSPREALVLSMVGCLGLMGHNDRRLMIGVNNINTLDARPGIIWPALVRQVLQLDSMKEAQALLKSAAVTSGHNYLISSPTAGEHWEITPSKKVMVAGSYADRPGSVFHTNHCLSPETKAIEDASSLSSTTFDRFKSIEAKLPQVKTLEGLEQLLTDHEGFPKSICSHYQAASIDPSQTCGGGIGDFSSDRYIYWRGCPVHDKNFKRYEFKLSEGKFQLL